MDILIVERTPDELDIYTTATLSELYEQINEFSIYKTEKPNAPGPL